MTTVNRRALFAAAAATGAAAALPAAGAAPAPGDFAVADVKALARTLGFTLAEDEAPIFTEHLNAQLASVGDFLKLDLPEGAPPVKYPARPAGHRPAPAEDPYNAWAWVCRVEGAPDGPLKGRTVSFKDHIAVAGMPVSYGVKALEGLIADIDATIAARVLDAGGVIVGKNTLNGVKGGRAYGGAFGDYARPLNPHDIDHVTGGSSSGSGAAVAAGQVDIAFGGDQGGSVRNPASYCGVIGLKPTFGLISRFGVSFGMDPSIDYVGPLARRTADIAAALQAVAGVDGLDMHQGRRVPERIDVTSRLADGIKGLRIGILDEGFDEATDPAVRAAVLAAADVLAAQGAIVSRVSVPEHTLGGRAITGIVVEGNRAMEAAGFFGAFDQTHYPRKLAMAVSRYQRDNAGAMPPATRLSRLVAAASARRFDGAWYQKAQNLRRHFIDAYDAALDSVDLLMTPTTPTTAMRWEPPPADRLDALRAELDPSLNPVRGLGQRLRNVQPFNYTGHPGISVPCGKIGRLPVGMQFVGRFFDEATLLRAAYAYEHSVNWEKQLALGA